MERLLCLALIAVLNKRGPTKPRKKDWFLYDNGLRHERVKMDSGTDVSLIIWQNILEHLFFRISLGECFCA